MSNQPVAWVLEWCHSGDVVERRLYDDETRCYFDAGRDGGVCRPLVYGDTHPAPDDTALLRQALEALEAAAPYTDRLICYASTVDEHPPNAIDGRVHTAVTALRARLEGEQ